MIEAMLVESIDQGVTQPSTHAARQVAACRAQLTASLLQPLVGLYADRRPLPYSLAAGMGSKPAEAGKVARSRSRTPGSSSTKRMGLGMGRVSGDPC